MIDVTYPNLLRLISKFIDPKRTESASFLIWYLDNYYRLDELEAIDSVCDNNNDKGIDGIYVNESEQTIDIFQAKISQKSNSSIGDKSLREFRGSLSQFKDIESLENLLATGGDTQIVGLINRLDLKNKLSAYSIRGIFISNVDIDANGQAFLSTDDIMEFVGKTLLESSYISNQRQITKGIIARFDISGFSTTNYIVDQNVTATIAPIKASELVKLDGISDQSIYAFNVRGPLGNTGVNRDIVSSIKKPELHKKFPLFHNGINIIAEKIQSSEDSIEIETYYVVNGCQSLTTLYENKKYITEDLRILTKFLQVGVESTLSDIITKYSNNQNGTKARDFKANNPLQIRLQNEIIQNYGDEYFYEIKRGELSGSKEVISNETIGIYLMSFDLKEPWNTHRKYQIFEDKYADLFGKPTVDSDRIVYLHVLGKLIQSNIPKIENQLFGKYALTIYTIIYILRLILEKDTKGKILINNPKDFVRDKDKRKNLMICIQKLLDDMIIDLNAEVENLGDNFDYKSKLRDEHWVKDKAKEIVSSYLKLVSRSRIDSFERMWENEMIK